MLDDIQHVTIGPEFFQKAPLDYSDPSFALIREAVQNGVDARGSSHISFDYQNSVLSFFNNGEPMTRDILVNKFLALGGSTKSVESVGGFGKAKELLTLCHAEFEIETGDLVAKGSGGTYRITQREGFLHGTRTTIKVCARTFAGISSAIRKVASVMNWKGELFFNGELLVTNFDGRTRRSLTGVGRVKVLNNSPVGTNKLIVRAGGVPMFIDYCRLDKAVIIDLVGDTKKILTANRDGLVWSCRETLSEFIAEVNSNRRQLNERVVSCTEFDGDLIVVEAPAPKVKRGKSKAKETPTEAQEDVIGAAIGLAAVSHSAPHSAPTFSCDFQAAPISYPPAPSALANDQTTREFKEARNGVRFIVRNETGMKIDKAFLPETFSASSKKLVADWTAALVKVHHALGLSASFAVGFVFSDECMAQCEQRDGVTTYYISPVSVETITTSKSSFRTMRKSKLDKYSLLAIAAHEITHGVGNRGHDENFASAYTQIVADVLRFK